MSISHPTSLSQAIDAAEEIELVIKFSRRPLARNSAGNGINEVNEFMGRRRRVGSHGKNIEEPMRTDSALESGGLDIRMRKRIRI